MKRFNFTQAGGFPLTQDRLNWMQDAYIPALSALGRMSDSTNAQAIMGVELTSGNWTDGGTVSDGWIFHPSQGLLPFIGGAFTPTNKKVTITDTATPLTFANGSQYNVQILRQAKITPSGAIDLKLLSATRWHAGFGHAARTEWITLSGTPNSYLSNVTVQYSIDSLTNMLHLRGTADFNGGAQDPPLMYSSGILLPIAGQISNLIVFPAFVRQHIPTAKNQQGQYITQVQGQIDMGGGLAFSPVKSVPNTLYGASFDVNIYLN